MEPTEPIKRIMADVQASFEYKTLQRVEGRVLEDGRPIEPELRERSIQLMEEGWEPIEEDEDYRRYRRAGLTDS